MTALTWFQRPFASNDEFALFRSVDRLGTTYYVCHLSVLGLPVKELPSTSAHRQILLLSDYVVRGGQVIKDRCMRNSRFADLLEMVLVGSVLES